MPTVFPFHVAPAHQSALHALGLDSLEACLAFLGGETVKAAVPGRDVRRVGAGARWYFLKRIRGDGWRTILHEGGVLHRLSRAGFPVPEPAAVGAMKGAAVLVTLALPAGTTLERLLLDGGAGPDRVTQLACAAAILLRDLHRTGVNHRDFYAGHLLVGPQDRIFLVDFGRAEVRRRVPRRRIIKDLAALHFSLPPRVFDAAARQAFLRAYLGADVGERKLARFEAAVERKSRRLRAHVERKLGRGEPNVHVNA